MAVSLAALAVAAIAHEAIALPRIRLQSKALRTGGGGGSFGPGSWVDPGIVRKNKRKRVKAKARTRHYNRLTIRKRRNQR